MSVEGIRKGLQTGTSEELECVDRVILTRTASDFGGLRTRAKATEKGNVVARSASRFEEEDTAREVQLLKSVT